MTTRPHLSAVIDVTDQREAARRDLAGACQARREAVGMLRACSALLVEAIRLRAEAAVDELTGALRRNAGFDALQREIDRARRMRTGLVVGFVDVDGLKQVNDHDGHLAGDAVLRAVAESLRACLRAYDVVVRYGGDEFVFSFGDGDLVSAERRVKAVRVALHERIPGATISVGLAALRPIESLATLLRRADRDMYVRRSVERYGGRSF